MTGSRDQALIYRFDDVIVEPATFRLTRGGTPLRIEPKALEVLINLIERRDQVVSKQELLDDVWRGTSVTENALSRAVAQIRKVLGDHADEPRYIQTIPTKGYRFIGELASAEKDAAEVIGAPLRRAPTTVVAPIAVLALVVVNRSVPITSLPRNASAPMLSPDRRLVAFNRHTKGITSVWTAAPDGSGMKRVTLDSDNARFPVWSPSGKQLALQVRRLSGGSAVAIVPAGGGAPRVLTAEGGEASPYSWSPDEKSIAFVGRRGGVWNVWSVAVASGETRRLTDNASTATWFRSPAWSPDGRRIVCESGAPRGNIWISEPRP